MRRKHNDGDTPSADSDRRMSRRFPLRLPVRYRPIGSRDAGEWTACESVNISSSGVLLTASEAIQQGQPVEALVSWPVFLDKHIPLKLVVKGHIVRYDDEGAAMHFETYEFRTSPNALANECKTVGAVPYPAEAHL
jgi:hypothetical protein